MRDENSYFFPAMSIYVFPGVQTYIFIYIFFLNVRCKKCIFLYHWYKEMCYKLGKICLPRGHHDREGHKIRTLIWKWPFTSANFLKDLFKENIYSNIRVYLLRTSIIHWKKNKNPKIDQKIRYQKMSGLQPNCSMLQPTKFKFSL